MPGEENVIQQEEQPVEKLSNRPDQIEKRKEYDALAGESGRGVFGCEKGAVGGSPKKAEIGIHSVRDPCLAFIEKAREGFLGDYSIRNSIFWIAWDCRSCSD